MGRYSYEQQLQMVKDYLAAKEAPQAPQASQGPSGGRVNPPNYPKSMAGNSMSGALSEAEERQRQQEAEREEFISSLNFPQYETIEQTQAALDGYKRDNAGRVTDELSQQAYNDTIRRYEDQMRKIGLFEEGQARRAQQGESMSGNSMSAALQEAEAYRALMDEHAQSIARGLSTEGAREEKFGAAGEKPLPTHVGDATKSMAGNSMAEAEASREAGRLAQTVEELDDEIANVNAQLDAQRTAAEYFTGYEDVSDAELAEQKQLNQSLLAIGESTYNTEMAESARAALVAIEREEERRYSGSPGVDNLNARQEELLRQREAASQRLEGAEVRAEEYAGSRSLTDDVLDVVSGAFINQAASITGGHRALYAAGQGMRSQQYEEEYAQAKTDYERALRAYEEELAEWGEEGAQSAYYVLEAAKRKLDAYETVIEGEVQQKATQAATELTHDLEQEGSERIERAKEGKGPVGRLLVDAGVGTVDLLTDAVINRLLGGKVPRGVKEGIKGFSTLNMAGRAFGGAVNKAEADGASVGEQVLFGAATATVSVLLDKAVDGVAGVYGKGKGDDLAEVFVRRLASTDIGRNFVRFTIKIVGEFGEEFAEAALEEVLMGIYDDGAALRKVYSSSEAFSDALLEDLYQGVVGAVIGAGAQGVDIARGGYRAANAELRDAEAAPSTESTAPKSGEDIILEEAGITPEASTAPESTAPETAEQTVEQILSQPVTNSQARRIIDDPALKAAYEAKYGKLPAENSAMRNAIKQTSEGIRSSSAPGVDALLDAAGVNTDAEKGDGSVRRKGRSADQKKAALKAGYDIERSIVASRSPERQQYLSDKYAEYSNIIEQLREGDVLLDLEGHVVGEVVAVSEFGVTIVGDDFVERIPKGTFSDSTAVISFLDTGGKFETKASSEPQSATEGTGDIPTAPTAAESDMGETEALNTEPEASGEVPKAATPAAGVENPAATTTAPLSGEDVVLAEAGIIPATETPASAESGAGPERERGFETNVATSETTDPELAARIEQDIQTYRQLGNAETLQRAKDIMLKGVAAAQTELQKALGAHKLTPEMVPLSRLLANELTRRGEVETARQIISDVAVELTAAGQLIQAAKILRTTDPQTVRASIEKALGQINQEFTNLKPRDPWRAKLTAEEEQLIANTDFTQDGAFEQVYEQIAKRLGKEMPASVWEKLTELRRINMLLRPRSIIKNIFGNVPMAGLRKGAEALSASLQMLLPQEQRTRGFASSEQREIAREYYKNNKRDILEQGDKWDINSFLRKHKTVFKGGALEKALTAISGSEVTSILEGARKFTYWALESGDTPFVRSAFVDSLSQYMAAQGITSADGITQEAIDFAMANAMEATFKNANVVAKALNEIKRNADPATAAALDVLFPFTTTPTNIFAQTMKYSPAGLAKGLASALFQGGNASNIDAISRGAVGSAVMALGFALRNLGAITGGEDDDKDKAALDRATGNAPYSIGGKASYDWAQPVGSLLALGAEISDAVAGNESWASAFTNALYTAGDSLLNMSIFQNVMSVLRGTGATKNIFDTIVESGATQLIPGLAGDIAKMIDPTVRSTYTGGTTFDDAWAKVQAATPGLSDNLPASINVKGEENTRGGDLERILNTAINPATMAQGDRTAVDDEIYRLMDETGSKTHFPSVSPYKVEYDGESYTMTGEERERFQTTQGQTYYELAGGLLETPAYKNASAEVQREILEAVRDYSLAAAKNEFLAGKGETYEWDSRTQENLSILDNPEAYLAAVASAEAAQKRRGLEFDPHGTDAFKLYIEAGLSNADLKRLSENLSDTQRNIFSGLTSTLGVNLAREVYPYVDSTTTDAKQAVQISRLEGLSETQKMQVLMSYLPADSKDGSIPTEVLRYQYAAKNDFGFDAWAAFMEQVIADEAQYGDNDGKLEKAEVQGTASRMGYSPDVMWDIHYNASKNTDKTDESAIKPQTPKASKGYRYSPGDAYRLLGIE